MAKKKNKEVVSQKKNYTADDLEEAHLDLIAKIVLLSREKMMTVNSDDISTIFDGVTFENKSYAAAIKRHTCDEITKELGVAMGFVVKGLFTDFLRVYYLKEKTVTLDSLKEAMKGQILASANQFFEIAVNKLSKGEKGEISLQLAKAGFVDDLLTGLKSAVETALDSYWGTK